MPYPPAVAEYGHQPAQLSPSNSKPPGVPEEKLLGELSASVELHSSLHQMLANLEMTLYGYSHPGMESGPPATNAAVTIAWLRSSTGLVADRIQVLLNRL